MGQPGDTVIPGGMTPQAPALAEWWKRLVAIIIDVLIIGIPSNIIGGILFSGLFASMGPRYNPATQRFEGGGGLAGLFAAQGALILMSLVLSAAYFIYLHSSRGQTVGKMAMKIKVVDADTGGLIDYGRAFVRWVIPQALTYLTCGIGALINGLWPLWDPRRQTWHDKAARTLVIDAP
ncbi:MAG: RDD family protein [Acidimicrobiia bacterium]